MAPARSPSSSGPSNSDASRKGGAFNLSKYWNGSEIPQRNAALKSSSPIPSPTGFFEQKENERKPNPLESSRALRKGGASNLSMCFKSSEIPQRNAASKSSRPIPSPHGFLKQKENERKPNAIESSRTLRKGGASNFSMSGNSSEILQRSAASKSSSPIPSPPDFFEQKENEREPNCSKQAKAGPFKGMKGYMAPTISAASKVTVASSRKKILAERNQVVRESTKCNIVSTEEVNRGEEIRRKSEIIIGSEEISDQNMLRKLDLSSSQDHHQPLVTHSLDSGALGHDPSLPHYDPIKNYLLPRPQFLYYKPNLKFEQQQDLFYVGDAQRHKDSFSDFDDSGNATVCSGTVDEDDDTLMMTQGTQDSLETDVSKPKPRSIGRSKLIPFVLILAVMSFCIPFIDSPLLAPLKSKDQSFVGPHTMPFRVFQVVHFYDNLDVASMNLQGFATRMRHWSISYIEIFSSFSSFPKELDMAHSLNATISSLSIVQSASLDFCYKSSFELAWKKNVMNEQDGMNSMEVEFQLNNTDLEALAGNGRDVVGVAELFDKEVLADDKNVTDKIKVEFSYEEDNFPKYEKRLILFTDPLAKFKTFSKIEQPQNIEITKSVKVYEGGVYLLRFNVARNLEDQALIALRKEGTDSSAYPLVEFQMAHKCIGDVLQNFLTELEPFISSGKNLLLTILEIFSSASIVFLFIKSKQTVPYTGRKSRCKKIKLAHVATNSRKHTVNRDHSSLGWCEMRWHPAIPSIKIAQRRESITRASLHSKGTLILQERGVLRWKK